tara:strand:- start:163 stop:342 length:180 start_codon:yes stop_codon:yes gene_type:complete
MSHTPVRPVKSTSPDMFLRVKGMEGADMSTRKSLELPIKTEGLMDTLYQRKETTTQSEK